LPRRTKRPANICTRRRADHSRNWLRRSDREIDDDDLHAADGCLREQIVETAARAIVLIADNDDNRQGRCVAGEFWGCGGSRDDDASTVS
jgi:hypothetical protein